MPTLENVDVISVLTDVLNENTEYYKSDFEHDKRWLKEAAQKYNPEDKIFYWLSRSHGTHLLGEREVFIKDAPENTTFIYWNDVNTENVKAYAVAVTGEADGVVMGNVYPLDYPEVCEYVKKNAVAADNKTMYYEHGSVDVAANNYENLASHPNFGRYVGYELIPNNPEYLKDLLQKVRAERGQETVENTQAEIEQAPEEQPPLENPVSETPTNENAADSADIKNTTDTAEIDISQEQDPPTEEQTTTPLYHSINEAMAKRAKEMNSYSDYRQGSATASYRAEVDKAVEIAERQKKRVDPQFHDKIDSLLATYCRKLAANINKGLEIETRCPSWLITGGGNFPVRKKEKQNAARETNWREYQDIQGLLDKIKSVGMGGISADDPNAIEKLENKLANLEAYHQKVKTVNAYFRKHKSVKGCPVLTAEEIEKMTEVINSERSMYKMPYPPYELRYNNAEMRRLKQRIEGLKARDRTNFVGWEFDGGRVEPNTADNRLQIYFDEKPTADVRDELKRYSFNWSPKAKVWQRQLNTNLYWICDKIECIKPLGDKLPSEILKEANAPQKEQPTTEPPDKSESFIAKMLDTAEIDVIHFTSQEQYDKWVAEHGEPPKSENEKIIEDFAARLTSEPTVTVLLTESNYVKEGQQMPFSEATELFSRCDYKAKAEDNRFKTDYRIDFMLGGKGGSYEGRYDFGSEQHDILSGIKHYHEFMLNTPDVQKQFADLGKLEEINQKCEFILNTFVPYMEIHKSLTIMEQAVRTIADQSETPENDFLYYAAVRDYVAECRENLNTTDFKDFKLPEAPKREDYHKPTMDELEKKAEQGEQIAITDMIDSIDADKKRAKAAKSAKAEKPSIVKRLADEKAKANGKTAETPKRTTKKKNQDLEVN